MSFFFNDTATTEIYTLSLHDALPISCSAVPSGACTCPMWAGAWATGGCAACCDCWPSRSRSEEHTSELQSQSNIVCRPLLEKKKTIRERKAVVCVSIKLVTTFPVTGP